MSILGIQLWPQKFCFKVSWIQIRYNRSIFYWIKLAATLHEIWAKKCPISICNILPTRFRLINVSSECWLYYIYLLTKARHVFTVACSFFDFFRGRNGENTFCAQIWSYYRSLARYNKFFKFDLTLCQELSHRRKHIYSPLKRDKYGHAIFCIIVIYVFLLLPNQWKLGQIGRYFNHILLKSVLP